MKKMKTEIFLFTALAALLLFAPHMRVAALAADQPAAQAEPPQSPPSPSGMMGGAGPMGRGMMRGPRTGGGMGMGMMDCSCSAMTADPKTRGEMMQIRGRMMKEMGELMERRGKEIEQGK